MREENKQALEENEQLTQANNGLSSYLANYREMEASEARMRNSVEQQERVITDLRTQVRICKGNEQDFRNELQDTLDELNELRI